MKSRNTTTGDKALKRLLADTTPDHRWNVTGAETTKASWEEQDRNSIDRKETVKQQVMGK